jgi:MYXO-CTERM domain-containing protein
MSMRIPSLAASVVLMLASTAYAEWEVREELVHETTTAVDIELTADTVICSHADYSANFLKVLIPQLAAITLLDHQNTDAGAPCVAAGECAPFGDHAPADILDDQDTTDTVDITVRATRVDEIDHDAETCNTSLTEQVDLVIRGVPFTHQRWATLGTRPYGDCISSNAEEPVEPADDDPPAEGGEGDDDDDDDKADAYGAGDETSEAGGCSAAGASGSGAGLALLLLGAVLTIRRRRRRR